VAAPSKTAGSPSSLSQISPSTVMVPAAQSLRSAALAGNCLTYGSPVFGGDAKQLRS
jgi:hypothetical protein